MSKVINILIPCYNESCNIVHIIDEIEKNTKYLGYDFRLLFIDDGSTDNTYEQIASLSRNHNNINVIKLSRNFGKESAIAVGLQHSNADATIILDADLQHPPSLIPTFIDEWEKGADIVDGVKRKYQNRNILRNLFSLMFNKLMSLITDTSLNISSDYKLLDKKIVQAFNNINEKNRFFRGLTNWVGFKHCEIEFDVPNRSNGKSAFNWLKLFHLSIDAITTHSSKPLHIITFLGLVTLLFSIVLASQTLYSKFSGSAVSGFTTIILVVLFLSSINMISVGVIGLYLSKIFNEVKNRPIFIIDKQEKKNKSN